MATAKAQHPVRDLIVGLVVVFIIVGAVSSSCSGNSSGGGSSPATDTASESNYAHTTCAEWLTYDDGTKVLDAAQFIRVLYGYDQSQSFAVDFAIDITKDCRPEPELKLSEVVAALATLDSADFPS